VGVLGGGPTGIACAVGLLESGFDVAIYEARDRLGGTPESSIPSERLSEEDAEAEIEAILAPAGESGRLTVKTAAALGENLHLEDLLSAHDAVYVGVGLGASSSLGEAEGVLDAPGFLSRAKAGRIDEIPARVAVLGAGNTAMDAASTAVRLGAQDVYLVYRRSFSQMPAWKTELDEALELGAHFLTLTQPTGYVTDGEGHVTGLKVVRTQLGEPDSSGRRAPVPGESEEVLPVSMVVEAMGRRASAAVREELERAGVTFGPDGLVEVGANCATSAPRVYAGGDIANGGTTAVQGIAEGMRAAKAIAEEMAG